MKKTFIDGVALGVFLALLGFFILALLFDIRLFGTSTAQYIDTIAISGITIAAAFLALRGIREQIQQNHDIERKRQLSSLRAARSSLPLTLSEIVTLSEQILLNALNGGATNPKDLVRALSGPSIIDTLYRCIESSDEISSDRLSQIIRYVQILNARYREDYFSTPYPSHEDDISKVGYSRTIYIVDFGVVIALCNSSFAFARGAVSAIPSQIDEQMLRNALITSQVFLEDYPVIDRIISSRAASGRIERDFSQT